MLLSSKSEKILKELQKRSKEYEASSGEKKEQRSAKISAKEIQNMFPSTSYMTINMTIKYLLEEKYIYNHIPGEENELVFDSLAGGKIKVVIGEKGIAYLEQKKYVLVAKVIPIVTSILSLFVSLLAFLFK